MKSLASSARVDSAGMAVSFLCIVHCLATPLLLVALPAFGRHSEVLEGLLVGLASLLALTSIRASRQSEGRVAVRAGFIAALFLMVASRAATEGAVEIVTASLGSIALISAHVLNCRRCAGKCRGTPSPLRGLFLAGIAAAAIGCSQAQAQEATVIENVASEYLGVPYRLGGASLRGIDCAALVQRVYRALGVELPRTAARQFGLGCVVLREELRVGDLVFFRDTYRRGISHVGIYIGRDRFIHAAGRKRGVVIASLNTRYYLKRYAGARRVADSIAVVETGP